MAKSKPAVPDPLPTSPLSIGCPLCKADPGQDCTAPADEIPLIHIQRIKAAATMDRAKRR